MEKIIYALWRDPSAERNAFNERLIGTMAERLQPHCHALRINVQDELSEGGSAFEFRATKPPIEAAIQLWVDSALDYQRAAIDEIVAEFAPHHAAWLVSESVPLPNRNAEWQPGSRSPSYTHLAFISVPPRLSWSAWRDLWQTHHTQVAIETQSTHEYVQNLIVRPLTYAAPDYAAIIEESFPMAAKHDDALFHDAAGNPEKYERNRQRLSDSTFSFVDISGIDLVPVGQYDFSRLETRNQLPDCDTSLA